MSGTWQKSKKIPNGDEKVSLPIHKQWELPFKDPIITAP
jgi:hypothetical protein